MLSKCLYPIKPLRMSKPFLCRASPARRWTALALLLSVAAGPVFAHDSGEAARTGSLHPPQATVPAPVDHAFSGTIRLKVDAIDTVHGIFTVREQIPVQQSHRQAGSMILFYPQWETASHAPTVPLAGLVSLIVRVDGRRVEWRRDPVNVYAFHIPLAEDARQIEVDFQIVADRNQLREPIAKIAWQRLLLYPAGWFARNLPIDASVRLPAGQRAFTSLPTLSDPAEKTGELRFATVPLDLLVDAPLTAGRYWRQYDLTPSSSAPVRLVLIAEKPEQLAMSDDELTKMRNMVAQTLMVFGPPPYRHYDMLLTLGDVFPAGGVEHFEVGEINVPGSYLIDPARQINNRATTAHELVHAWNGRFRQPSNLWTPTYNEPVQGSLLWVYEGGSEFWGMVLSARAKLVTRQEALDKIALYAAGVENQRGRAWKGLADSGNDAVYMAGRPTQWTDWTRKKDYYGEGVLLWLDVDARLRELTGGRQGIDAFAKRFYATGGRKLAIETYDFDDVCAALAAVAPDDWAGFLNRHLATHDSDEALAGLRRSGWRLDYGDTPTEAFRQEEAENGAANFTASIGMEVDDDGRVSSLSWDGPAFRAKIPLHAVLTRINGDVFSLDRLRRAIADSPSRPVLVSIANVGKSFDVEIDYRGGPRYPHLVRIDASVDRLSDLLATR